MATKKKISSVQAAKILGTSTQNVRCLGKLGLLTTLTVDSGKHKTVYYFEHEVLERKAATAEYLRAARSTEEVLAEARDLEAKAKERRAAALAEIKIYGRFEMYKKIFSELVVGCLEACEKEYGKTGLRWQIAEAVASITPFADIQDRYNLSARSVRKWITRAVRSLRAAPGLVESNAALRERCDWLEEENAEFRSVVEHHEAMRREMENILKAKEREYTPEDITMRKLLSRPISDLGLSVRSYNCLRTWDIARVADLVYLTKTEISRFRNFGKKSFNEVVQVVEAQLGLHFDMDITRYGLDPCKTELYNGALRYSRKRG